MSVAEWDNGVGKRVQRDGSTRYVIKWRDGRGTQRLETLPAGTRIEVARKERAKRVAAADRGLSAASMTYSAFLPRWREVFETRHSPGTIRAYDSAVRNHLEPAFGRMRLRDVRLSAVQDWIDRGAGRLIAPRTLRRILATHSSIMKAAARLDLCEPPNLSALQLPALVSDAGEMQALTYRQLEQLAEAAGEWWGPMVMFLGTTGLRRGEFAGLDEAAIDVQAKLCHVRVQWTERNVLAPVKSKASNREVQLFAGAIRAALDMREAKLELGLRSCEIAFPTPRGRRIGWGWFYENVWDPAVAAAGYGDLTVHDLRHTAASLMISAGLEPMFVKEQLGHEKLTTTLETYAHWFKERSPQMVDRFDQAYER